MGSSGQSSKLISALCNVVYASPHDSDQSQTGHYRRVQQFRFDRGGIAVQCILRLEKLLTLVGLLKKVCHGSFWALPASSR
jgi:hypothetical protein